MDLRVVWSSKKIYESVLGWFDYIKRMENERIAKRVYVGESVGSRLLGRP